MTAVRTLLFIAVVALAQPCFVGAETAAESPMAVSAIAIPADRIDRAVRSLDQRAQAVQRRSGVPGMAIAVVHEDRIVFMKGYGVRKAGTNQRVDANTVFQLASLSKTVGASVVAGAVGRGIVSWSDPISKYLPDVAFADPYVTKHATIADMYAHSSGLPGMAGDMLEELGYARPQILRRLRFERLDPFRIAYH